MANPSPGTLQSIYLYGKIKNILKLSKPHKLTKQAARSNGADVQRQDLPGRDVYPKKIITLKVVAIELWFNQCSLDVRST